MEKIQPQARHAADVLDEYTGDVVKPFDDMLTNRVLDEIRPGPSNKLILGVGTGVAHFLVHLAGIAELKGWRFVGMEAFADTIARAQLTVDEEGLADRIELLEQDVHAMNLPDEFADIVVSRSTLHHWRRPAQALAEIFRVLKPGGIAIIHDIRRNPSPEAIAEFNRLRAMAGLSPSLLEEKLSTDEVGAFLVEAGLAGFARILAPKRGLAALGMAVEIMKPMY